MKKLMTITILGFGLAVLPFGAALAAGDDADVTMQVVQPDQPDAVTNQISLPDAVPDNVKQAGDADEGLQTANDAKEHRLEGQETAEDAMQNKSDAVTTEVETESGDAPTTAPSSGN